MHKMFFKTQVTSMLGIQHPQAFIEEKLKQLYREIQRRSKPPCTFPNILAVCVLQHHSQKGLHVQPFVQDDNNFNSQDVAIPWPQQQGMSPLLIQTLLHCVRNTLHWQLHIIKQWKTHKNMKQCNVIMFYTKQINSLSNESYRPKYS